MFARYFVELPMFSEEVEQALSHDPRAWLPGLAERANQGGDLLLAEVGIGEVVRIKRTFVIELGRSVRSGAKTVFPLRWASTGAAGLFPSLDADLEVAPLGPGRTQLSMSARYVPPFGPVGRAVDRAVLSRVAEATLKDFLDRVAETILEKWDAPRLSEVSEAEQQSA
ncbi:MAG TPA: hypothetical protein VFI35_00310 [Actinomycetota bacterium]|nr:hypothetical protein [Actinomycetota bacterium]